jgi:hypothetical protein
VDAVLRVDLRWREPDGRVSETSVTLQPGWHTILLRGPRPSGAKT